VNKFWRFLLPVVGLALAACGNSDEYIEEALSQEAELVCKSRDFPVPAQVGFVADDNTSFNSMMNLSESANEVAIFSADGAIYRLSSFYNLQVLPSEYGGMDATVDDDVLFANIAGIIFNPPDLNVTHAYHDALYHLQNGERVMIIVLDGWGWYMHQYFAYSQPFLATQYRRKAHTVFPPFTPVVMSSIFTGQLPNVHGVHDRTTRTMSAPDIFENAYNQGFSSTLVQGGVNIVAASERPHLVPNLGHVFETDRGVFEAAMARIDDSDLLFIHFNSVDDISHTYGPYTPQVGEAMELIDEFVSELVQAREGVAIILGDHGQHLLGETDRVGDHLWISHEDIFVPYVVIRDGGRNE